MTDIDAPPTLTGALSRKLELEAYAAKLEPGAYTALTSIAISLKRIADQIDGSGGTDRDKTNAAMEEPHD